MSTQKESGKKKKFTYEKRLELEGLLKSRAYTISEIADIMGFSTVSIYNEISRVAPQGYKIDRLSTYSALKAQLTL